MTTEVLVVDDEVLVAENLRAFLEDEGMTVHSAGSAEQAIDLVGAGRVFDVCIMDLRLPGMDGSDAIRALHALDPKLRFIIHTGSVSFALPDELRALGIQDIQLFKKPVLDMALLASTVRALGAEESGPS